MQAILIFLLVVSAIGIIALVLLQQGKGADVGASFGSGASNTMFGSQGAGSFLMKVTLGLAVVFFIICILLARIAVVQTVMNQRQNMGLPPIPTSSTVPAPSNPVQSTPAQSNTDVPAVPK